MLSKWPKKFWKVSRAFLFWEELILHQLRSSPRLLLELISIQCSKTVIRSPPCTRLPDINHSKDSTMWTTLCTTELQLPSWPTMSMVKCHHEVKTTSQEVAVTLSTWTEVILTECHWTMRSGGKVRRTGDLLDLEVTTILEVSWRMVHIVHCHSLITKLLLNFDKFFQKSLQS